MAWRVCDWIIYHNDGEKGKDIKCCAVGSEQANHAQGTVIRSFYGTYPEVRKLVEDLNTEAKHNFIRHYVRREKNVRN